jgi:hypothetical protein
MATVENPVVQEGDVEAAKEVDLNSIRLAPAMEQLRATVEADVKARYDAKFVKEIGEFRQRMQIENDAALKQVIEEFKKSQQPPTQEEIKQLLSQEYLTFNVEIPWESETSTEKFRTFTIKELPQSVEKKFYKNFKEELIPRASDLGALTFNMLEGDVGKKITTLLETLDPGFDLMANACVMILNPRGKEKDIDRAWVQDNLSSYRQWNIINAQIQINRLRDFFSQISRGSKGMTTNLGAAHTRS